MTGSDLQHQTASQWLLQPVIGRIKAIASSGLSPRSLAKTVCVGAAIGLMPLLWGSSLLCILAGRWFRLNQLVLQSINYLLYPLQLALLVPFFQLGMRLLPWGPMVSSQQLSNLLHGNVSDAIPLLIWVSLKGLLLWLVTVPLLAWLSYYLMLLVLFGIKGRQRLAA